MRKKFAQFFLLSTMLVSSSILSSCNSFRNIQFLVSYDETSGERIAYLFSNEIENNINKNVKFKIDETKKFYYEYKIDNKKVEIELLPEQFHAGFGIWVQFIDNYSTAQLEEICQRNDGFIPDNVVLRYDVESLNYKNGYNAKVNSDKTGIDLIETNLAFPELKSFSFKDNGPIFDWKNGKILSSNDLVADQECYFAYYYGSYEKESVLIPCGIEVNIF